MAGQIGELARDTLRRDFRVIDPREGRVLLVEMADRVLTAFPPSLSEKAARSLEHLGVTPLLGHTVVDIDDDEVTVEAHGGGRRAHPDANRHLGRRASRASARRAAGRGDRRRGRPRRAGLGRSPTSPSRAIPR